MSQTLQLLPRALAPTEPAIGLALGGGGAKGLAHILVLEAFDELGLRPAQIVGCSMGAIIGAIYASGMSARDIRAYAERVFGSRTEVMRRLLMARVGRFADFLKFSFTNPVLVDGEIILDAFLPDMVPKTFAELQLPFSCVAVDYHQHRLIEFSSGALLPAVAASIAVPGLLKPVLHDSHVLVDGGILNTVPYDCLRNMQHRIAVDVLDGSSPTRELDMSMPNVFDTLFGSVTLMMQHMTTLRMKADPPSLLLLPPTGGFRVLDFFRYAEIFKACEPFKSEVKRKITRLLASEPVVVQQKKP